MAKRVENETERYHKKLKEFSDSKAIEGMARYGITPEKTYGVCIPNLKKIAKEVGKTARRPKSHR